MAFSGAKPKCILRDMGIKLPHESLELLLYEKPLPQCLVFYRSRNPLALQDFYVEMKWSFTGAFLMAPLMQAVAPSDTYRYVLLVLKHKSACLVWWRTYKQRYSCVPEPEVMCCSPWVMVECFRG